MKQTAIVLAASRGIGAACARRLKDDGYDLVIMSRSKSIHQLADVLGCRAIQGSVTRQGDIAAVIDLAVRYHGKVDVLVNNTGHPHGGDLLAIRDEQWEHAFSLLVLNVIRAARLVTPIMRRAGGGAIVNISAADAMEPDLQFPLGGTLRSALGAWTKLFATRFAADNIRMNCVLPGIALADPAAERDDIKAAVPLGRASTFEEVASVVAFLASAQSSYITGQCLRVDGGMTKSI